MTQRHPIFSLLAIYWRSSEKWLGATLAIGVLAIGLTTTIVGVQYNEWYSKFYNALQKQDASVFWATIPVLIAFLAVPIILQAVQAYFDSWLQLRWRRRTTDHVSKQWLYSKSFYRIERDSIGDNPDQRISDDISQLIELTLQLTLRLATTSAALFSYGYITWIKGGSFSFQILNTHITVPGFMFWAALAFAIFDCAITHITGRRLLNLNVQNEKAEANLRYSLMQIREHSEEIAMYDGEAREHSRLKDKFSHIWEVSRGMFIVNLQVSLASGFNSRIISILPLLLMAPSLFSGQTDLGTMMATQLAWITTASSLAWFATNYTTIAKWRAAAVRLELLTSAINSPSVPGIKIKQQSDAAISTHHLYLSGLKEKGDVHIADFTVSQGERLLITGPSGSGKSTLLRACARLWSDGGGEITFPSQARILFLPQRIYLPSGTLKSVICYPSSNSDFTDQHCIQSLVDCRLAHLASSLHKDLNWSSRLSLGEQQRIGFVRILLHRPDILFLDEATSSLDSSTEHLLYNLLLDSLPDCTLISVAHHASLKKFHDKILKFGSAENSSAPATL